MTAPSPKVEQRHRDAAADYGLWILFSELGAQRVRDGLGDDDGLVQAFAAFERDLFTPSGDAEGRAREALDRLMMNGAVEWYPEKSDDARIIRQALTPPPAPTEAAGLREALELLRQTMNALACSDKGDPLEPIGGGMTVWGGMRAESARLWPKCTALLAALAKSPPAAVGQ